MSSVSECKPCQAKSQYEPVALSIYKRGRDCIIAKLTTFLKDIEPILAIAVKNQIGTSEMVSLPVVVIEYAQQRGATWLYWRRDHAMEMRRVDLQTLRRRGYLQRDGEIYFPLSAMEPVPWRQWEFAKRVIKLNTQVNEVKPNFNAPKQLALAFEVAANER